MKNKLIGLAVIIIILIVAGLYYAGLPIVPGDKKTATTTPTIATTSADWVGVPTGTIPTRLYFIRLEDAGRTGKPVGCGDSVVSKTVYLEPTSASPALALEKLLAFAPVRGPVPETDFYSVVSGGRLEKITITDGLAVIDLSGVTLGGVCDEPRLKAQIEETAKQFSGIKEVKINLVSPAKAPEVKVLSVASAATSTPAYQKTKYESEKANFTIDYPVGWSLREVQSENKIVGLELTPPTATSSASKVFVGGAKIKNCNSVFFQTRNCAGDGISGPVVYTLSSEPNLVAYLAPLAAAAKFVK